jgi:CelD/BcsL family acetyltransferase involved in cellulose biosynthesis
LDITVYRDERGFAALAGEWNDLLRRSRHDTIFLTWEWQTTWWRHVGASRGPLYLLALRQAGRLIGILPLYLTVDTGQRALQVVGCIEVSDYLDLIVEAGQEEAAYLAFLDWLPGPDAPAWDLLDLCNQPAASLAHSRLPELARERGWRVDVLQEDVCPVIALPDDWEKYLERLDKKERHEIRRKLRRLEREAPDAALRIVTGGPELAPAVRRFIALHRLSSRAKDAFMTDEMQGFFYGIAEAMADRAWLQLSFLAIGEQEVASYFCFAYGNEILVYNSGYDPQGSPQLSPGWVLLAQLIQRAISQGRTRFDFLQGNEDYKYRFGGVDTPVYRTLIRRA